MKRNPRRLDRRGIALLTRQRAHRAVLPLLLGPMAGAIDDRQDFFVGPGRGIHGQPRKSRPPDRAGKPRFPPSAGVVGLLPDRLENPASEPFRISALCVAADNHELLSALASD